MDAMSVLLVTVAVLLFLTFVAVRYLSQGQDTLKELGILTPPVTPLLGNFGIIAKLGIFKVQTEYYEKFKDQKVYGWYDGRAPVINIRDLDIIKDICTKHFNVFCNRRQLFRLPSPLDMTVPLLRDEQWKRVRAAVSPTFSSGRVKRMSQHVERNARRLMDNLRESQEKGEEIELRNVCSAFSLDVIASVGFGLDVNTLKDPENAFAVSAKKIMSPSVPLLLTALFFPEMVKYLHMMGLHFFPEKHIQYLVKVVQSTMESRKAEGEIGKANDFLDLIIEATEEEGSERGRLSQVEIQAQAMMFILAGFDTVSQVLSFTLFLLTVHPECYQKVMEEIHEKIGDEAPTYDNVQALPYLDACINECTRLFPPAIFIDRVCNEDITIHGVHFPKNIPVSFPIFAIHRDPEIWPNPEKFQPDRFSPENKESRHPFAHLPFGQGPRTCMGMRMALLELRVTMAYILQKFKLVTCDRTVYPIRLNKMLLKAEGGLWVKVEAIK